MIKVDKKESFYTLGANPKIQLLSVGFCSCKCYSPKKGCLVHQIKYEEITFVENFLASMSTFNQ
jgi:hypothetical protein